ncbi:MAG: M1 family metallopeptidase [Melioribacteraceae bacterium]|nr:M1 family metallopeptidase [Melioribacteraceae bacterium]
MNVSKRIILFVFTFFLLSQSVFAQNDYYQTTRRDTLRGILTPLRTCYDVNFYNIDVRVDPEKKWIGGAVYIEFTATTDFNKMQIDLFNNMQIVEITHDFWKVDYTREFDAVFVEFSGMIEKGAKTGITVYYAGRPIEAKRPPWEGGVSWNLDSEGNPWVVVTSQGTGASLWWPHKDHQSDEPDSVSINITVPPGLTDVSNGRLRKVTTLDDGWQKFSWFVSYAINDYSISFNIGKYEHFSDVYKGKENDLTLDYYVMPENLEKAKVHFKSEVQPMHKYYEESFGEYPFIRDGYKLIEVPYWGMEHQSAVTYGNGYQKGTGGREMSIADTLYDFIIVHESAHEWFGNNITSEDLADMWIHEGLGVYSEMVYLEKRWGKKWAIYSLEGKKRFVRNQIPVIGPKNVAKQGASDMYPKGALLMNTLRHVVDNDSLWWKTIYNLNYEFRYQVVTTEDIIKYFNNSLGKDYTPIFDQYLRYPSPPILDLKFEESESGLVVNYRWLVDVKNFQMPVKIMTEQDKFEFIYPTEEWKSITLENISRKQFAIASHLFYVRTKIKGEIN